MSKIKSVSITIITKRICLITFFYLFELQTQFLFILPLKTNTFFITRYMFWEKTASIDVRLICRNRGSTFQLGCVLLLGVGRWGFCTAKYFRNCLWRLTAFFQTLDTLNHFLVWGLQTGSGICNSTADFYINLVFDIWKDAVQFLGE